MPVADQYLLGRSPSFPLAATQEGRTDLALSSSAPPSGIVRGTVSDPSGAGIGGATVKLITPGGAPVDHQDTNPAGNYIFNNVAPGSYSLVVAKTGYVTSSTVTFTIEGGQQLTIDVTLTPSTTPQGTIYGFVTDSSTGAPLASAPVILTQGSPPTAVAITLTDAAGEVMFCEVPDGSYSLLAAGSEGYLASLPSPVTVNGGAFVSISIAMLPVPVPQATVNGFITDAATGNPIPNACVGLYTLDGTGLETLQQVTFTDSGGRYLFSRAGAGNYVVKAKAETTAP